jgi:hypothetical protein
MNHMTEQQIQTNAEDYAWKKIPYMGRVDEQLKQARIESYIDGAHSMNEEIAELRIEVDRLRESKHIPAEQVIRAARNYVANVNKERISHGFPKLSSTEETLVWEAYVAGVNDMMDNKI